MFDPNPVPGLELGDHQPWSDVETSPHTSANQVRSLRPLGRSHNHNSKKWNRMSFQEPAFPGNGVIISYQINGIRSLTRDSMTTTTSSPEHLHSASTSGKTLSPHGEKPSRPEISHQTITSADKRQAFHHDHSIHDRQYDRRQSSSKGGEGRANSMSLAYYWNAADYLQKGRSCRDFMSKKMMQFPKSLLMAFS